MMTFLKGRKTYFTVAIGLIYTAGCALGFWDMTEEIIAALGLGGLAFLRAGVAKAEIEAKPEAAAPSSRNSITGRAALVMALAPLLLLTGAGCANVAPGNDAVVVNAERTTQLALEVFDAFTLWEYGNRQALAVFPEIRRMADHVRANGQGWLQSARNLTKAYKTTRSDEDKFKLGTALEVLDSSLDEIRHYYGLAAKTQ